MSVFEFFGERSPSVGHYMLSENSWHRVHRALRGGYEIPTELSHVGEQPLFSAERRGTGVAFQRHSECWMAQAFGRKVWLLIPAYHPRPEVGTSSWWRILPTDEGQGPRCGWCRKRAARSFEPLKTDPGRKAAAMGLPPDARVCLTHPGDVIFVPRCWWYASVSVEDFSVGIGWMGGLTSAWDESMRAVLSGEMEAVERWCALRMHNAEVSPQGALRLAAEAGDLPALQAVLNLPIGLEAIQGSKGGDVVAAAARTGQMEILELLERLGADLRLASDTLGGSRALHWTARYGHVRAVAWLLSHKAELEAPDHYGRALHYAAYFGHVDIASLLLGAKASVSGGIGCNARSQLPASRSDANEAILAPLATKHGAAGLKAAIRRCGDMPADLDAFQAVRPQSLSRSRPVSEAASLQLVQRRTPLHLAAAQGHLAVVMTLLRAEADTNAADAWGLDPFAYAEAAGHKDVAVQIAQAAANAAPSSSEESDDLDGGPEPEPERAPRATRR